jgi:hypothetical protein
MLTQFDYRIKKLNYYIGGRTDLLRLCKMKNICTIGVTTDEMRNKLRIRDDPRYITTVGGVDIFNPFFKNKQIPPTYEMLEYSDFSEERLRTFTRSSSLCDISTSTVREEDKNKLIKYLERYDARIVESGFMEGNMNDLVRMCEIRMLDYRGMLRGGRGLCRASVIGAVGSFDKNAKEFHDAKSSSTIVGPDEAGIAPQPRPKQSRKIIISETQTLKYRGIPTDEDDALD